MRTIDSYLKKAKICWIIAGVFFAIAVILKVLVLVITIVGG